MSLLPDWAERFQVDIPVSETTVGIYTARSGDDAIINFKDSSAPIRMATAYRPVPGEPVTLTCLDGQWRVTGPVRARSATGTITQTGYPTVGVLVDGRDYQLGYSLALVDQLTVGDLVAIVWAGGGYVSDKVTVVAETEDGPRLTTDQDPFTLSVFATTSASYKNDRWTTGDVIAAADDSNGNNGSSGAWFYGPTIRDSLDDQATIQSVQIYLPRRSGSATPTIGRHSEDTIPAGDLSLDDEAARPLNDGWVNLPLEWVADWRDSPGGIGISGEGAASVLKGIQADRQSGKLLIRGRQ